MHLYVHSCGYWSWILQQDRMCRHHGCIDQYLICFIYQGYGHVQRHRKSYVLEGHRHVPIYQTVPEKRSHVAVMARHMHCLHHNFCRSVCFCHICYHQMEHKLLVDHLCGTCLWILSWEHSTQCASKKDRDRKKETRPTASRGTILHEERR